MVATLRQHITDEPVRQRRTAPAAILTAVLKGAYGL
jgi:hypothetical protein